MNKLKLALYWGAACGGCDVAVLDINEKILDVANLADIVLWPVAMDFKYSDVKAMGEKSIDVCLFNGAIRNSENEELAKLLREKSKVMVAFGSCACFGGVPALANFYTKDDVFQRVYKEAPSMENPEGIVPQTRTDTPEGELELPELYETVRTLEDVVPVEYYVPGCPPVREQIVALVDALAKGELPPPGTVLASGKALCDECTRVRKEKKLDHVYRSHQIVPDPELCLLEQGLLCMGPVTRGGCGMRCTKANMPCRGCFGPAPGVEDQAARMISAVASIYQADDESAIQRMLEEVVDPAGSFYRFSASKATFPPKVPAGQEVQPR